MAPRRISTCAHPPHRDDGNHPRRLDAISPGTPVRIIALAPVEPSLGAEMAALRILPGETVEVVQALPLGGPLLLQTTGGLYALGRELARRILVAEEPAA